MLNFTISNLETARDLIIVGNYNKILSIVDSQKEPYFYFGKKVFNYYEANKDAIDWHVSQFIEYDEIDTIEAFKPKDIGRAFAILLTVFASKKIVCLNDIADILEYWRVSRFTDKLIYD